MSLLIPTIFFFVLIAWGLRDGCINWNEVLLYILVIAVWGILVYVRKWSLVWLWTPIIIIDAYLIMRVLGSNPRIR